MGFVVALAGFLALWNNVANRLPGFARWYVPVNLGLAGALVGLARWRGLSWAALGLAPGAAGVGAAVGVGLAALVGACYAAALALPRARPLLRDARVSGLDAGAVAYGALVRIPLGTVVLEEVAFRGVLLAAWAAQQPLPVAVLGSSAVFGLWHLVPARCLLDANGVHEPVRRRRAVAGAVAATSLAGAGLCLLRLATGSIVAPAVVHVATNSFGFVAAAVAMRRGPRPETPPPPPPRRRPAPRPRSGGPRPGP